jgi:hypothetical protein
MTSTISPKIAAVSASMIANTERWHFDFNDPTESQQA